MNWCDLYKENSNVIKKCVLCTVGNLQGGLGSTGPLLKNLFSGKIAAQIGTVDFSSLKILKSILGYFKP